MSHLGHMSVGNVWSANMLSRGLPHILKEVMGAEPVLPYVHPGKTAKQILFSMKFNLELEKDLVAIAESAAQSTSAPKKLVIPTMTTGDMAPKCPSSVNPKDKYQLAKKIVEDKYYKSNVEKPWANMWFYYCDEDRARLSGGIGYVGHHGGGDLRIYTYHEFIGEVVYPLCFVTGIVTIVMLFILYYYFFGTFCSGRKGRYD
eukprot:RCo009469